MAKKFDASKIMKCITKACQQAVQETGQQVAVQLQDAFETAIDHFYNSYDPKYYNRSGSLYLASNSGQKSVYRKTSSGTCVARVVYNPYYVKGEPYAKGHQRWVGFTDWSGNAKYKSKETGKWVHIYDKNIIMGYAWYEGSHGGWAYDLKPPTKVMYEEYDKIFNRIPSIFQSKLEL